MESHRSCESFFCKTHTSRFSKAYQRCMDALKALLDAYKSAGGLHTEATTLAFENYLHHHEVFVSTCNDVEIKRQEAASNSNAGELGPFSPTPELNRALAELIEYSESNARYGGGDQVAEEMNMTAPEEAVEHNTAEETVDAMEDNTAEETMEHNTAEETMQYNTAVHEETMEDNTAAPEETVEDNTAAPEETVEDNTAAPEETVEDNTAVHEETMEDNTAAPEETVERKTDDTSDLIEHLESDARDVVGAHMTEEKNAEALPVLRESDLNKTP